MLVYRITRNIFAADLNGAGARLYGGRWNSVGVPMLYTASTRALAVLETLVHTTHNFIPNDLMIITIEISDDVTKEEIKFQKIAADMKEYGITAKFNTIGDKWIKENNSLLLIVPSIVVTEEKNVLINPAHIEFIKIKIVDKKPFDFDDRLLVK